MMMMMMVVVLMLMVLVLMMMMMVMLLMMAMVMFIFLHQKTSAAGFCQQSRWRIIKRGLREGFYFIYFFDIVMMMKGVVDNALFIPINLLNIVLLLLMMMIQFDWD